jgi:peptidyl-dipeptidase Dcp
MMMVTLVKYQKMARPAFAKKQLNVAKNFAEWKIQDQMAQTPESHEFISQKSRRRQSKSKVEAKENLIDGQNGGFKLEPWDWNFTQTARKAKHDLDESQVKPYFELTTVLKRVFFCC